jgi:hypothetical protein
VTSENTESAQEGGPDGGSLDPLVAAMDLFKRAVTERERIKAAEAIRAATLLRMRAARGATDPEMLIQLDRNIAESARLVRSVGGFENELRALAGHREALRARIDAITSPEMVQVPVIVTDSDGEPIGGYNSRRPPAVITQTLPEYFDGVPRRFWDSERFDVQRIVHLAFGSTSARQTVRVFDKATGEVVWS